MIYGPCCTPHLNKILELSLTPGSGYSMVAPAVMTLEGTESAVSRHRTTAGMQVRPGPDAAANLALSNAMETGEVGDSIDQLQGALISSCSNYIHSTSFPFCWHFPLWAL